MCLRKDNPRLDVIATHPLYDGVRAVFLFAYNFAKVTAAQLPVLIMASQSVNVFCKGLMGCSQGCSIINCRARGARLPLQQTGQSLQGGLHLTWKRCASTGSAAHPAPATPTPGGSPCTFPLCASPDRDADTASRLPLPPPTSRPWSHCGGGTTTQTT